MPIDESEFRRILGHWASGVAIATAQGLDGRLCGLTANAFCSLSLVPPLVLVCIERDADSHDCIRSAGTFAISVLDDTGERLARRFAGNDPHKFDGVAYRLGASGAPLLEDALAWVECRVHAEHPGGDHTIFIGVVTGGDARSGTPLLYFRGGYGSMKA
jgi:flavin reductase (DIM6/NTAB) family NADH-FMN oxidoreductase RutF